MVKRGFVILLSLASLLFLVLALSSDRLVISGFFRSLLQGNTQWKTYINEKYGFRFDYPFSKDSEMFAGEGDKEGPEDNKTVIDFFIPIDGLAVRYDPSSEVKLESAVLKMTIRPVASGGLEENIRSLFTDDSHLLVFRKVKVGNREALELVDDKEWRKEKMAPVGFPLRTKYLRFVLVKDKLYTLEWSPNDFIESALEDRDKLVYFEKRFFSSFRFLQDE